MHELVRISLHNWYAFEAIDLDVGGTIALLGPTGSGKSAVLDGIATVLTGANHNFLHLNASAGERHSRTISGYCLGAISDFNKGQPRRERSESVLALVFRDQDNGLCYSAGLLIRADKDVAKEEIVARFLVRGHSFRISDYLERDKEGDEFVVSHDEILERLKSRYRGSVTFHNASSQSFVEEMLTAMRPKSSPDAVAFLRSFSNAIQAKEIKDPTDFVRRFVLPPQPLNVGRIRASIKVWKDLETRTYELEQEVREIRVVRGRFATWARQTIQAQSDRYIEAHAERLRLERETAGLDAKAAELVETIGRLATSTDYYVKARASAEDDIRTKTRLIDQSGAGNSLRAIEVEEKSEGENKRRALADLEKAVADLAQVAQLAPLRELLPEALRPLLDTARSVAKIAAEAEPEAWLARIDDLTRAAKTLAALAPAAETLRQERDAQAGDIRDMVRRVAELREQLSRADAGGPLLSQHVSRFQTELRNAGIFARALPDLVEVLDESWAPALEMVLGPNREALLVADRDRDRAFDLLWRRRNEFYGCRLVNTRRTRGVEIRTMEDSIARVVKTDDPDIRAFIDREAGRIIRAETENDLELHERAITRDGKSTAGTALRVYRDERPILGRTAQAATAERMRQDLVEARERHEEMTRQHRLVDGGVRRLELLAQTNAESVIRDAADRSALALERLADLKKDRGAVEDARTKALREEIEALQEEITGFKAELETIERDDKKAKVDLELTHKAKAEKQEQAQTCQRREGELVAKEQTQRFRDIVLYAEAADETIHMRRQRLQTELELHNRGREMEFLAETRIRARRAADDAEQAAKENGRRALREFADYVTSRMEGRHPLPSDAEEAAHLVWCSDKEKRLEEHELRPHRDKVAQARREVEDALGADLLSKLSERFDMVRTQIETLNRRLADYSFVGQTYSFSRSTAADIKPLYELSKRIGADPSTGLAAIKSGNSDDEIRRALDQIEQILESEDDVRWLEDYRNYFEFELHLHTGKDDNAPQALSKIIGLLSGGQRQAPYYVAIAASMVSVYFPRSRDRGTEGVGLVALDEAFHKLDIANTQKLIGLYRDLGLQLLVAAPESARSTFLEAVDCIISVSRPLYTDDVNIDVEQIGERAKGAMAAENPEHKGIEGFRRSLAQAAGDATSVIDQTQARAAE